MDAELLERFHWFNERTKDPTAAAILTLAAVLSPQPKRTGLTTIEAAEYLGVSRHTIIKLCNEGRLQKQRIGNRSVRFNASDLDAVRPKSKDVDNDPHQRHFV